MARHHRGVRGAQHLCVRGALLRRCQIVLGRDQLDLTTDLRRGEPCLSRSPHRDDFAVEKRTADRSIRRSPGRGRDLEELSARSVVQALPHEHLHRT